MPWTRSRVFLSTRTAMTPCRGGPLRPSRFPFIREHHYNPIRDRSVLCETVDSRTHSGFVPRAFTALRFPILWEAPREHRKGVLPYNPIRDGSILCETVDSRTHSGFVPGPFRQLANPKPAGRPPAERRRTAQADHFQ